MPRITMTLRRAVLVLSALVLVLGLAPVSASAQPPVQRQFLMVLQPEARSTVCLNGRLTIVVVAVALPPNPGATVTMLSGQNGSKQVRVSSDIETPLDYTPQREGEDTITLVATAPGYQPSDMATLHVTVKKCGFNVRIIIKGAYAPQGFWLYQEAAILSGQLVFDKSWTTRTTLTGGWHVWIECLTLNEGKVHTECETQPDPTGEPQVVLWAATKGDKLCVWADPSDEITVYEDFPKTKCTTTDPNYTYDWTAVLTPLHKTASIVDNFELANADGFLCFDTTGKMATSIYSKMLFWDLPGGQSMLRLVIEPISK